MRLVTIKRFDNSLDTHLLKTKLESEGINCVIFDENLVAVNPLFNHTIGGIKLKIDEKDVLKAQEVLAQFEANELKSKQGKSVICPNCNSKDLYSNYKSMKGPKGILSVLISFLLTTFPLYFKTVYKCKSCGLEFKQS